MADATKMKVAAATQEGNANPQRAQEAIAHDPNMTAVEFTLLNSIEHVTGSVDRTMFSIAETLTDDDTLTALEKYSGTFEVMGLGITEVLAAAEAAKELIKLEKRLEQASVLVHRKLATKLAPVSGAASEIHAVLASLPEGSPMLNAFSTHMEQWQKLYGKGGRPPKAAATPTDPVTPR